MRIASPGEASSAATNWRTWQLLHAALDRRQVRAHGVVHILAGAPASGLSKFFLPILAAWSSLEIVTLFI
jgi:hypothetical protein